MPPDSEKYERHFLPPQFSMKTTNKRGGARGIVTSFKYNTTGIIIYNDIIVSPSYHLY